MTEAKKFEAALAKNESMLAEAQHLAHIGSWEYTPSEDRLVWSKEVFHILGLDSEVEPTFELFLNAIHPEDRGQFEREVREWLPHRSDYRIVRPDGSIRYIHEEVRTIKGDDGSVVVGWGSAQDVTDVKMAELYLAREEEHWRLTFDSITDLVSVLDSDYRFIKVNRAFAQYLGASADELIGKHCYRVVHDTREPVSECPFAQMLSTGKTVRRQLYDSRSGQHLEVTASPIYNNRMVHGGIHFIKNITREKEAESERESLFAQLASKNRELEQIIYVTSHDLRSPLININGFTRAINESLEEIASLLDSESVPEEIRNKLSSIVNQEVRQAEHFISRSVSRMETLLAGLLRLSRLGRVEFSLERLNVNRIVSDMTQSIAYQVEKEGIRLDTEDLPPCRGDRSRVEQVFSNLLDNAIKYRDPSRPGKISVTGEIRGSTVRYCVEDNGIGIKKEYQQKIFDLFYRLDPGQGEGEGLGLTIIKKIIDLHGGTLEVTSEPGKGSRFCFSLPAADS
jgi:PAS domain S-box-containing protein